MAKSILGVAFGPGVIQIAELSYDAKSAKLSKVAEYKFVEGDALDKPAELGKKLGAFLKQNKFGAKLAVAGLPTQWLMLKERTVGKMSADNLAGMLRLQSERDFSLEPTDLALDYVGGDTDEAGSRALLLVATKRERVEQIAAVLKAAALTPVALTSSALALASASYAGTVLSAGPFGAELIVLTRGSLYAPCMLASSVAAGGAWLAPSAAEARRLLAMRSADPTAPVGLWNGSGDAAINAETLSAALDAPVCVLGQFAGVDATGVPNALRFGHAAALARFGRAIDTNALNFLNSKLLEKTPGMFAKVKGWMAVAAMLAIVGLGWLAISWVLDSFELNTLRAQSETRRAEAKTAKEFLARYESTQGWYEKRPNLLECMNELLQVLPENGGAWISKLTVKEDLHCEMSAKAISDRRCFDVLARFDKNEAFRDVRLVFINRNNQDKKSSDVSFAISFIYWKQ